MKVDKTLELLTKAILDNGLDYKVTLSSKTTVELFDPMTNISLGTNTSETLEEAITELLAKLVSRGQYVDKNMLSIM